MNAKEYLKQAINIDRQINAKLEKISYYRSLSTRATSSFNAASISGTSRRSRVEDNVCKIIMLENEVNSDIDRLVALKAEIEEVIRQVKDPRYRTLLEYRYICGKTWEQIAVDMKYDYVHVIHRLHPKALMEVQHAIECNIKK